MIGAVHFLTIRGRLHRVAGIGDPITAWLHQVDGWYVTYPTLKEAVAGLRAFQDYQPGIRTEHTCIIGCTCCSKGCGICGQDLRRGKQ